MIPLEGKVFDKFVDTMGSAFKEIEDEARKPLLEENAKLKLALLDLLDGLDLVLISPSDRKAILNPTAVSTMKQISGLKKKRCLDRWGAHISKSKVIPLATRKDLDGLEDEGD